ncbi:hypothetical protein M758_6G006300 [Ceratodon purpureus]|nr:hypothetical protein M758_6G006300 [Ceratodon purpureus]
MSQQKKDEAVWEDCGCPLSMAIGDFTPDVGAITSLPHMCTISSAEYTRHYIFDHVSYEKLINTAPDSPLAQWTQKRCQEQRMFVARPPDRPIRPPEPWRYDEPPFDWALPSGWRAWAPSNPKLVFSDENSVEDYQMNLDSFFLYMNIKDPVKQEQMRDGVEAWVMACGEADVLIKGKHPSISDRCFVTSSGELFAYLFAAGDKLNDFLKDLKLRKRTRHLRRLVDLMIDAKVKIGGCGHTFNP